MQSANREKTDSRPVVGVDVGGTKILAAVVTPKGDILSRVRRRTRAERGQKTVIERIAQTVLEAIDEADLQVKDVSAVGVGVPGPVNPETGVLCVAVNLGWQETPLRTLLAKQLHNLPVYLGNDCNCATLGEYYFGAAKGLKDVVGVFVGTGIGGGIIVNGQIHEGVSGAAAEVGHMIVQVDGPKPKGGFKGSMEALGSRLAIVRYIEEAMSEGRKTLMKELVQEDDQMSIRSKMIAKAYQAGDKVVVTAVKKSAEAVGCGVASLASCLAPEMIVIGGGVVDALGQAYVTMIEKTARERMFPIISQHLKIVKSKLGDDVGILGDAAMVGAKLGWKIK